MTNVAVHLEGHQPSLQTHVHDAVAAGATHAKGQQHPIKLYLVVWGWLFVLSTFSYLVDYFRPPRLSQMVADPAVHGVEGRPDRRRLHAHGLGAAGPGLCHPAAAGGGAGVRRHHGVRIRVHAPHTGPVLCRAGRRNCRVRRSSSMPCSHFGGYPSNTSADARPARATSFSSGAGNALPLSRKRLVMG